MNFLDFVELSNGSHTGDQLALHFGKSLQELGIDGFVYSLVRGSFSNGEKIHFGVAGSYPQEWVKYYNENGYVEHDPTFRRIVREKGVFTWKSLFSAQNLTKKEQQVLSEAEDAGLKNGLSLSIHGPYGEVLGLGFISSSKAHDLSRNENSILYALANQFHLAYTSLNKPHEQVNPVVLTDRQKEVLQWSAVGKGRDVIADIMGISVSTVDDHFKQIFKKLGCNDKVLAVLKAVQLGLITV